MNKIVGVAILSSVAITGMGCSSFASSQLGDLASEEDVSLVYVGEEYGTIPDELFPTCEFGDISFSNGAEHSDKPGVAEMVWQESRRGGIDGMFQIRGFNNWGPYTTVMSVGVIHVGLKEIRLKPSYKITVTDENGVEQDSIDHIRWRVSMDKSSKPHFDPNYPNYLISQEGWKYPNPATVYTQEVGHLEPSDATSGVTSNETIAYIVLDEETPRYEQRKGFVAFDVLEVMVLDDGIGEKFTPNPAYTYSMSIDVACYSEE